MFIAISIYNVTTECNLPVTGGTTGNVRHSPQIVLLHQILTQSELIGIHLAAQLHGLTARRRLVTHIENLAARANIFRRTAVAIQTPLHLQRRLVIHQRHAVHRAVAGIAADAFINVNAVIEIHEVGEVIHPVPHQRFSTAVTLANRLQHGRTQPYLRVAVHAGLRRRNTGKAGSFHRGMTVAAIKTDGAHMVLMTEGHRLRPRHVRVRDIRRSLELNTRPKKKANEKKRPEDRGLG